MRHFHILFLALFLFAAPLSALAQDAGPQADEREKAIILKNSGDLLAQKEDFKGASEKYLEALSLYKGFSDDEQLKMSTYMSWAGKLGESIGILRSILSRDPGNARARIQLARVLSWAGDLDASIAEAQAVLKDDPGNREALLIKANSLRWQGKGANALPIFEELLSRADDFEVRLGYAFALLATGDMEKSKAIAETLKPEYPYQQRDLESLNKEIKAAQRGKRPRIEAKYSYYNDTDFNQVNRYTLGATLNREKTKYFLGATYISADGIGADSSAYGLSASAYRTLANGTGVGAGAGLLKTEGLDGSDSAHLTANIKADHSFDKWSAGAVLSSDVFTDTAKLIQNGIGIITIGGYATRTVSERLSFYLSAFYKDYSDDNSSIDLNASPRYALITGNPGLAVGYRLRYLDFKRQSRGDYFDPDNFISNQVFASFWYEKGRAYASVEPYVGHQRFKRNAGNTSDWFEGGAGVAGYRLTENASIEVSAEGGNYAVGSATGFKYYMLGLNFVVVP